MNSKESKQSQAPELTDIDICMQMIGGLKELRQEYHMSGEITSKINNCLYAVRELKDTIDILESRKRL